MIYIDSRLGSKELLPLFPQGTAQLTSLKFGDFAFTGSGPGGRVLTVGIERKTANDLLQCIKSGRLSNQLLGMRQNYDVSFLLVEAQFRENAETGYLEYFNQYFKWYATQFIQKSVWGFLNDVMLVAGVRVFQTRKTAESVAWITSLYSWFNEKEWEQHRACYAPHIDLDPEFRKGRGEKAPLVRRWLNELSGVGHDKAKAIEAAVGDVEGLFALSEEDFEKIPGIGKTLSKSIWNELHPAVTEVPTNGQSGQLVEATPACM